MRFRTNQSQGPLFPQLDARKLRDGFEQRGRVASRRAAFSYLLSAVCCLLKA
jgi:hypothetical protein